MRKLQSFDFSAFTNRAQRFFWVVWVIWFPFTITAFIGLFQSHYSAFHIALTLLGVLAFFVIYLGSARLAISQSTGSPLSQRALTRAEWLPLALMLLLSLLLGLSSNGSWLLLFVFTSASAGGRLPIGWAIGTIILLIGLVMICALFLAIPWTGTLQEILLVPTVGLTALSFFGSIRLSRELQSARAEISRLAIAEERLRIARDLHDVLGHRLSLIVLKSELASRLVPGAPERAVAEMRDVENAARQALHEAREAIASYRQPTLAGELQGAREMLSVAGIACLCADQAAPLRVPATLETALAWTIREGVTNVIRHSRGARTCTIQIEQNTTHMNVSIIDDGHAITETLHSTRKSTPHGLAGLAERVALYQGRFEAGPQTAGGFRLFVSLPLETPVQPAENVESDQPVQEVQQ